MNGARTALMQWAEDLAASEDENLLTAAFHDRTVRESAAPLGRAEARIPGDRIT